MTNKALEIKEMDNFILNSKDCFEYEEDYENLVWEWTNYALALDCKDEDYEEFTNEYRTVKKIYNRLIKEYAYALNKKTLRN